MPQHAQRFWLAAFVVAWTVDFLFWGKPIGISLLIFVALALAAGFVLARGEAVRVDRFSILLSGLILILSAITLLRSEPFTRVLNAFLALGGLALLAMTFRTGNWTRFRILDYVATSLILVVVAISRAAGLRLLPARGSGSARRDLLRKAAPVLRGLLLALPVVIVLAALLASADLIFADQLNGMLKSFNLSRLPEYLFRLFYILALAYIFAGLYLQAVLPTRWGTPASQKTPAIGEADSPAEIAGSEGASSQASVPTAISAFDRPLASPIKRFFGVTEAFIVLGSVNLLFAFFVAIQFRYFFGGQANINAAGYTYSEYARRGFFELVLVAVISLLLYLCLNAVTRREKAVQARVFTILSVLLVGLVLVILASAFQRLLLYEDAYGFTSQRIYTHIFIPWLGFFLLATIGLQVIHREQVFGALLPLTVFGFALTFWIVNIDGLIVRQNVARAHAGAELDGQYLVSLSDDALPELAREFRAAGQPEAVRDTLGVVLSCRAYRMSQEKQLSWQSFHAGKSAAWKALSGLDLSSYPINQTSEGTYSIFGNYKVNCFPIRSLD